MKWYKESKKGNQYMNNQKKCVLGVGRLLILFLILTICSITVFAKQPIIIPSSEFSGIGIRVAVPTVSEIPINENYIFHVHAHNSSLKLLPLTDVDCNLHFYDPTGSHLIESDMLDDSNTVDKYFIINDSLVDSIGEYAYLVYCNSTQNEYGFTKGQLEVVYKIGKRDLTDSTIKGLGLILITFALAFVFFKIYSSLDQSHFLLKLLSLIFAALTMIVQGKIALDLASNSVFAGSSNTIFATTTFFIVIFYTYIFIYLIYEVLKFTGAVVPKNGGKK